MWGWNSVVVSALALQPDGHFNVSPADGRIVKDAVHAHIVGNLLDEPAVDVQRHTAGFAVSYGWWDGDLDLNRV